MNGSFWKRPLVMMLLIVMAVGGGVWFALDRPMPTDWGGGETRPDIRLPEFLRREAPERIFCAESPDTGVCRCIRPDGSRPDISEEECRQRVRESRTSVED